MAYEVPEKWVTEVTAPAAEPVTVAEMKAWLNVDSADDDVLIAASIAAARQHVERYTGRALVQRTYRVNLPYFYDMAHLPYAPLGAVTLLKYYDSDNVLQTLIDTSASPQVSTAILSVAADRGVVYRAYGETLPTSYPRHDAVQLTYTAGYALGTGSPIDYAANVPDGLKLAVRFLVADMYLHRETQSILKLTENRTATALMQGWRLYRDR